MFKTVKYRKCTAILIDICQIEVLPKIYENVFLFINKYYQTMTSFLDCCNYLTKKYSVDCKSGHQLHYFHPR